VARRYGTLSAAANRLDAQMRSNGEAPVPTPQAVEAEDKDKDLPLRDDIRLLGRLLGDTVNEQAGSAVFDTVESIRQNAVRFHRDEDAGARRELEATLNGLPPAEALQIIRAFGFFSHLATLCHGNERWLERG
jgi:phosphoenolpyruvate carboxylase